MGLVTKPTATGSGHLVDDAFFVRLGCVCVGVWVCGCVGVIEIVGRPGRWTRNRVDDGAEADDDESTMTNDDKPLGTRRSTKWIDDYRAQPN